ncbi:MAG: hypothetical protein KAT05_04740 [Spirochaetes bacterium]|nr:hypothetical protein [Spirochaetota bacterium]
MAYNSDPDYAYLLNSINIARLKHVGHIHHPGTPLQTIGAIILRFAHFIQNSKNEDIQTLILKNPELYLNILNIILIFSNFLLLFFVGVITYKFHKDVLLSIILQLSPFYSTVLFDFGITRFSPELLILFSCLGMVLLIVIMTKIDIIKKIKMFIILFAIVSGFGISSKIIFLPIIVIPLIIIPGYKNKILYLCGTIFSFVFFTLPIIKSYKIVFDWFFGLLTHSGYYGTGKSDFINLSAFFYNLKQLFTSNIFFFIVLLLSIFILVISVIIPRVREDIFKNLNYKILFSIVISEIVGVIIVSKHYYISTERYLLPELCLIGLNLFVIIKLIKQMCERFNFSKYKLSYFLLSFIILYCFIFVIKIKNIYSNKDKMKRESIQISQIIQKKYKDDTKVFFYPCSSRIFALKFGSDYSGHKCLKTIQKIHNNDDNIYFYNGQIFTNLKGQIFKFKKITEKYENDIIFQGGISYGRNYQKEFSLKDVYNGENESVYKIIKE